jgi:DNA polymerase-3 subunit gamma/tau
MNCAEGPVSTPCNQCPSCREITAGSSPDVFEIDGASNNKVEHARDLLENVAYAPVSSRYKIYIIDEVHMLSNSAFNTLLKTLEEPPAHVMFVFATTEPHKVLPTILSRCQRYDLARISMSEVVGHLKKLTEKEAFEIDEPSLWAVARATGGCMRDALSLLDQIIASAQGAISHQQVLELIGAADSGVLSELADALFKRDIAACLTIVEKLFARGFDMKKVAGDLILHLRNCAVIKMVPDASRLVDIPASEIETIAGKIRLVPPGVISLLLNSLLQQEANLRYASNPRLALEIILMRTCETTPVLSMDSIIQGLDQLEKRIAQKAVCPAESHPREAVLPKQPKPAENPVQEIAQNIAQDISHNIGNDKGPQDDADSPSVETPNGQASPRPPAPEDPAREKPGDDDNNSWKKKALKHPLINDAVEIFDGDIFDILKHKIPAQPETSLAEDDGQTAEE